MTIVVHNPIAIAAVFLWIGFVCAISFMEAWMKFRAPGISVPLALGIGKIVFSALNKVELLLILVIIAGFYFSGQQLFSISNIAFFIPVFMLFAQTLWVMPVLNKRAEMLIKGYTLPASNYHFYYVLMELIKVGSLFVFSYHLFNHH
jgi:hypothetical protein